ncbi:MAG: hypothetical protein OWS74_01620, partial [Firmicutes bacterium]|nr:hypothetical protein [Bacillota bacterium]
MQPFPQQFIIDSQDIWDEMVCAQRIFWRSMQPSAFPSSIDPNHLPALSAASRHTLSQGPILVENLWLWDQAHQAGRLLRGHRQPFASKWGDFGYIVEEDFFQESERLPALLRALYHYHLLELWQGPSPDMLWLRGPQNQRTAYAPSAYRDYLTLALKRIAAAWARPPLHAPVRKPACAHCVWIASCQSYWTKQNALSRLPSLPPPIRTALEHYGIHDISALSALPNTSVIPGLSRMDQERWQKAAYLLQSAESSHKSRYSLLTPWPGRGLTRLPSPHPADRILTLTEHD